MGEDKLTRWARPAIVWLGLIFTALTDVILPTVSQIFDLGLPKLTIDANFWDAWAIAVGLYVGGRSVEKIGLPGKKQNASAPDQGP